MTLRHAAVAWAVLVLAVAGRVAVAPPRSHTVTPIYWNAAERFGRGEPLYAPAEGLDAYLYPPGFAASVRPFTWLPEKLAGILWRLLGVVLFLGGLFRLGRDLLHLDSRNHAWLMLLTIPLAISSLDNGQANLYTAGLLSLGAAAVGRERLTAAAGWFAVAAGIKLYPFAAGLLVGVTRPLLAPRLVLLAASVVLFPFVVANADYVRDQFQGMVAFATADDRMHSPSLARVPRDWTLLTRSWVGWIPTRGLAQIVSVVAGLAFAGLVFAARNKTLDRRVFLAFSLGSIWMTLFGPATEPQTYTLLAATLAATVLTAHGWAKVLAVLAWWLFTVPVIRDAFPNGWKFGAFGLQPAGATLFLAAVLLDSFGRKGIASRGRLARWLNRLIPPVGVRKRTT